MNDDPTTRYRFLADEQIPGPSIRLLRALGYDVLAVAEVASGVPDRVVLDMARQEQRVLLTFDRDHGRLIYRERVVPPPGVLHIRFAAEPPERPALHIVTILNESSVTLFGRYTVLRGDDRITQRPLPQQRRS